MFAMVKGYRTIYFLRWFFSRRRLQYGSVRVLTHEKRWLLLENAFLFVVLTLYYVLQDSRVVVVSELVGEGHLGHAYRRFLRQTTAVCTIKPVAPVVSSG